MTDTSLFHMLTALVENGQYIYDNGETPEIDELLRRGLAELVPSGLAHHNVRATNRGAYALDEARAAAGSLLRLQFPILQDDPGAALAYPDWPSRAMPGLA